LAFLVLFEKIAKKRLKLSEEFYIIKANNINSKSEATVECESSGRVGQGKNAEYCNEYKESVIDLLFASFPEIAAKWPMESDAVLRATFYVSHF